MTENKTKLTIESIEWDMDEVESPEDALASLPKAPFIVLVPTSVLSEDTGVADALSDEYGFSVISLSFTITE